MKKLMVLKAEVFDEFIALNSKSPGLMADIATLTMMLAMKKVKEYDENHALIGVEIADKGGN